MGIKENPQTIEQLVELTVNVQTTRTCMAAAELEPETTESGHALPNQIHVAAAGINTLRVRQRMGEILRGLPGSSLVNAPADTDFADPKMAAGLEDAFGGGGYTAMQRAALLQLAWDQVSSGLDGREAVFELHASGGLDAWRRQLASWFGSYNELANGVQEFVQVDLPSMDLSSLQEVAPPLRRVPQPSAGTLNSRAVNRREGCLARGEPKGPWAAGTEWLAWLRASPCARPSARWDDVAGGARLGSGCCSRELGHHFSGEQLQAAGGDGVREKEEEVGDAAVDVALDPLHALLRGAGDGPGQGLPEGSLALIGVGCPLRNQPVELCSFV